MLPGICAAVAVRMPFMFFNPSQLAGYKYYLPRLFGQYIQVGGGRCGSLLVQARHGSRHYRSNFLASRHDFLW
jgi:hypothetical protein